MALPHPKQQIRKSAPKSEEIQVSAPFFENFLFSVLGAITAFIVGLSLYGDDLTASRRPASVQEEWDARPYLPYGY